MYFWRDLYLSLNEKTKRLPIFRPSTAEWLLLALRLSPENGPWYEQASGEPERAAGEGSLPLASGSLRKLSGCHEQSVT